ncbi:lysozyme [Izhakiella australiensis]|uniref:Lysozyme n=1 Tax=Izhakiella australiensis TaxID=1926881 RepID=A0A1S8YP02_9GAMM|nr:glycoside hydrolase family protein [Izhakiella australiensis]OON40608.1 lysozyme [Izhakiella australiensis]
MSQIIAILAYEEGYKEQPYCDSEGYPTVACGIRIGPRNAAISLYTFSVPHEVGMLWMQQLVDGLQSEMLTRAVINAALQQCNEARNDILTSMAYQLGIYGLSAFTQTLTRIAAGDFVGAAQSVIKSQWARQTPARATRHAQVIASGTYDAYRGLL